MENDSGSIRCVDLRSRDNKTVPPNVVDGHRDEVFKHFMSTSDTDASQVRILCLRVDGQSHLREALEDIDAIFPDEVIKHAIWKPAVYWTLTQNAAGGAAGLTDNPACFVLQTPLDGGPFCSMALMYHPRIVKGIYLFNSDAFDPSTMAGGEASRSAWRSSGLQIITLPEMFLQVHSAYTTRLLPDLLAKVASVESTLAISPSENHTNFDALTQTLHACHSDLITLERRSRFEGTAIAAIETITATDQQGTAPWPSLSQQKTALASRNFDFESLPRRIENCRATMNSLLQRRTEALNLELAQASHQIAEAALKDNKSMKTIAILTMVLLPGTAVASLFSMGLFDWEAADGARIASKWLWIYFVVSVPLTGVVLFVWWVWTRKEKGWWMWRVRRVSGGMHCWVEDEEAAAG